MLYQQLTRLEEIEKGWSGDKKYRASDTGGTLYLLRIAPEVRYDRRKSAFDRTRILSELDIPCPIPLEFGICDEGIYTIESWIEGHDGELYISTLPA